jgi:hypothetical protein
MLAFVPFLASVALAAPVPHAPAKVTRAWNGRTVWMKPGQSFLLQLGDGGSATWTAASSNPRVLARRKNVTVVREAQGIYDAHAVGRAVLRASNHYACQDATPPCVPPNLVFRLVVIVRR